MIFPTQLDYTKFWFIFVQNFTRTKCKNTIWNSKAEGDDSETSRIAGQVDEGETEILQSNLIHSNAKIFQNCSNNWLLAIHNHSKPFCYADLILREIKSIFFRFLKVCSLQKEGLQKAFQGLAQAIPTQILKKYTHKFLTVYNRKPRLRTSSRSKLKS